MDFREDDPRKKRGSEHLAYRKQGNLTLRMLESMRVCGNLDISKLV